MTAAFDLAGRRRLLRPAHAAHSYRVNFRFFTRAGRYTLTVQASAWTRTLLLREHLVPPTPSPRPHSTRSMAMVSDEACASPSPSGPSDQFSQAQPAPRREPPGSVNSANKSRPRGDSQRAAPRVRPAPPARPGPSRERNERRHWHDATGEPCLLSRALRHTTRAPAVSALRPRACHLYHPREVSPRPRPPPLVRNSARPQHCVHDPSSDS